MKSKGDIDIMKKVILLGMSALTALSLSACQSRKQNSSNSSSAQVSSISEKKNKKWSYKHGKIITNDQTFKQTKSQLASSADGKEFLILSYDVTNTSKKDQVSTVLKSIVEPSQNGKKLQSVESDFPENDALKTQVKNLEKKLQPSETTTVSLIYKLIDQSEVTLKYKGEMYQKIGSSKLDVTDLSQMEVQASSSAQSGYDQPSTASQASTTTDTSSVEDDGDTYVDEDDGESYEDDSSASLNSILEQWHREEQRANEYQQDENGQWYHEINGSAYPVDAPPADWP
ncbi:hypothetical protein FC36_GL000309 [Ligilactobacillus equi DSM 15833 = JCM 10991]|uniref:DUF5067 domain-containing protein n=2 Tax=Ligilactobacillus equi TaxID=137357 RepID=A0A0R1TWW7_9LACO|nr:hypothetical protein FC36_GL000309 [Ligilactobacillus equi DSM 15833 = JCM 10991]